MTIIAPRLRPHLALASHTLLVSSTLVGLVACGDNFHGGGSAGTVTLRIDPPDAVVTIVNGGAVTKAYSATLVDPDGDLTDVTHEATFELADVRYGEISIQ